MAQVLNFKTACKILQAEKLQQALGQFLPLYESSVQRSRKWRRMFYVPYIVPRISPAKNFVTRRWYRESSEALSCFLELISCRKWTWQLRARRSQRWTWHGREMLPEFFLPGRISSGNGSGEVWKKNGNVHGRFIGWLAGKRLPTPLSACMRAPSTWITANFTTNALREDCPLRFVILSLESNPIHYTRILRKLPYACLDSLIPPRANYFMEQCET